jgi:hypothetical protein
MPSVESFRASLSPLSPSYAEIAEMSARIAELAELTNSDFHLTILPYEWQVEIAALLAEMRELQAVLTLWLVALRDNHPLAWQPPSVTDVEPPPNLIPLTGSGSSIAPPRLLDPVTPMESAA